MNRRLALAAMIACTAHSARADEPKVGDKAPEFSMVGTDGKIYKLSDYKGKEPVVLAWFPKADTPGCTKECKSFSAAKAEMKALKVAYFTASVDSPADNKKFADKFAFTFPILSNPDKSVAKAYGVLNAGGMARRWTYYIDKDGVIREIDKKVNAAEAAADASKTLKSLGLADAK